MFLIPPLDVAFWYGRFLAEQVKRSNLTDAELCVLAEIGGILRDENYRDLKKTRFNELLAERIRRHMRTPLKSRRSWLKEAGRELGIREQAVPDDELRLPEAKIKSVYLENFRSFGSGIDSSAESNKGTTFSFSNGNGGLLSRAIVFGPNGSGKSSLCEGMEWQLTGFISECDRRGMDLPDFCRRYSCVEKPDVKVRYSPHKTFSKGQERLAKSCFIEKNRIQDFALLAKDKGKKDIIALLIGLEDLKKIADEILVLPKSCGIAGSLLSSAKDALESWKNVNTENENKIAFAKKNENANAEELTKLLSVTNNQCHTCHTRRKMHEDDAASYKERMSTLADIKFDTFKSEDLLAFFKEAQELLSTRNDLQSQLQRQGSNVSYKDLYAALNELSSDQSTSCPACDTPLSQVAKNPFDKAREELPKLASLQKLQSDLASNEHAIEKCFRSMLSLFDKLSANYVCVEQLETLMLPKIHGIISGARAKYFTFIEVFSDQEEGQNTASALERITRLLFTTIGKIASEIQRIQDAQNLLAQEQTKLENLHDESRKKILELERTHEMWVKAAQSVSNTLTDQKAHLEQKKALENNALIETAKNDFLGECHAAYASVHKQFLAFKHGLEKRRTEKIQQRIAYYYQQINAGDTDAECVNAVMVQVPDETHSQYALILRCKDGSEKNAMHILSEGHLRALGLSIMLAVAEKYDLPFLIFDDAVNAIDSDHRANIIEMLFTDEYLKRAQILVTTHDRLFWERFCLELGNQMNDTNAIAGASFIVTYPASGTGSVFAQYSVDFEQKIKDALDHFDLRQAMIYLRIWLETEVLNYIDRRKNESLSGRLHKSRRYRGNALEPDIQGIFTKMAKLLKKEENGTPVFTQDVRGAWAYLHTELIDDVMNQDNHAYSEALLNITHSKTSDEVREIFNKVKIVVTALQLANRTSATAIATATQNATTANIAASNSDSANPTVGHLDVRISALGGQENIESVKNPELPDAMTKSSAG